MNRQSDGLCEVCSENLWAWQPLENGLFTQTVNKLSVYSLFHWVPGRQEVLSKLARALKGNGGEELWKFYADEFWRRTLLMHNHAKLRPIIFIPSPTKGDKKDHAFYFTQGLVEASGGALYNCLQRETEGPQKEKSVSERRRASLAWNEDFTLIQFRKLSAGKQIVFVDDVVTTGSTAKAAWKTLGKPRDFAVWSLAQRGLSCGASMDLV